MDTVTYEFILRLFIAAMLGGAIGLEREYRAKEAGFRTHFLVALGSGLFMVLSQFGFTDALNLHQQVSLDPSRIASQVVTGIGFIGAGTIIFQKQCGTWTHHSSWFVGNISHRYDCRSWHVRTIHSSNCPCFALLRGTEFYPSTFRNTEHQCDIQYSKGREHTGCFGTIA